MVYSTNPDFAFDSGEEKEADTPPKNRQKLRVGIERKNRGGKVVTVVKGIRRCRGRLERTGADTEDEVRRRRCRERR